MFCLVEKKISEKCCRLGVWVKRNDDQNTNNFETRFYLFTLHIIPYTSRLWFVCLYPGSRMSGTNRLPRNYYIHLKSYIRILSKKLPAKEKQCQKISAPSNNDIRTEEIFFLPVVICSVFFLGSLNPQWYINHSSSTELRYERRPLSLNPASWRYSKRSHSRIPPLSSEC